MSKGNKSILYADPVQDKPMLPPALQLLLGDDKDKPATVTNGVSEKENSDGSVTIDFDAKSDKKPSKSHNDNLAEFMDESELAMIADDLMQGVQRDLDSRQQWMQNYTNGMTLLGLQLETERADAGMSSAPLEGMSRARHPVMLEAILNFQAQARGEMLPAAGPVKVRDDAVQKPAAPEDEQAPAPMGHNGGPPMEGQEAPVPGGAPQMQPPPPIPQPQAPMPPPQMQGLGALPGMEMPEEEEFERDSLADALEKDFNHFLTVTDKNYYPDTDQMNFNAAFCGIGIKKVYNCPLKRRPVSETINIEDFIISNTMSSICASGRYTHRIYMRPSQLKRMQLAGAYREVPLQDPSNDGTQDGVRQAKANLQGITINTDPKDQDYTLYESYCELDLDQFAPKRFKGKGIPLPYIVTIDTQSRQVLQIRKNWREDDKEAQAKEYFVDFVFDRAFGFYGIGFLHILGNTTRTLTAAWREFIDSGMFASFPGFLYAKGMGRQLTNQFRIPPGGGMGLDIGLQDIRNAVMPLPYKDLGPSFVAFIQHVEQMAQRLGGTANIEVAEGKQEAPVGTTMALIEQASKQTGAVLKRFHSSQAREFQLLKERFKDDPESFWRFNRKPTADWHKEMLLQALEDYDIVPVSDPSNPTRLHRAAKAAVVQQLAMAAPMAFDIPKTIIYIGRQNEVGEIEDLLNKSPPEAQGPQLDPNKQADIEGKMQVAQTKQQTDMLKLQIDKRNAELNTAATLAEIKSKENIAQLSFNTELLKLASSMAIHSDTLDQDERLELGNLVKEANMRMADQNAQGTSQQAQQQHERYLKLMEQQHTAQQANQDHARNLQSGDIEHQRGLEASGVEHQRNLQNSMIEHQKSLQQSAIENARSNESAEQDRAHQIQLAKLKPKPVKKGK